MTSFNPALCKSLDKTITLQALETLFASRLQAISALGDAHEESGRKYIDNLTKPLGSLGMLEEMALSLYRMADGKAPLNIDPAILFTVAGDHGVAEEGVSPCSQAVTRQMLLNFLEGGAGVNALCRNAGMDFMAVDAGVLGDQFEAHPSLIRARIAEGTANFTKGPAMSRETALRALLLGLELTDFAAQKGYRCLATGEMGIGNTTPSSAIYSAWLDLDPTETVGPGAGLPKDKLAHKAAVVRRALEANSGAVSDRESDPVGVLAALGGIEIAVMSGIMLGAAAHRLPMLVDGFIAGASFIAAWKIAPALADYCLFAHCSAETAHAHVLNQLGRKPMLDLGLRLGEGTGAALGMCILRGAVHMFNDMASFKSAKVEVPV